MMNCMTNPDFVKAGEPIRASTINDLISRTRNRTGKPRIDLSGEGRIYRPFDPISIDYGESKWFIVLKPSWIIEDNQPQEITFEIEEEQINLSSYPIIEVQSGKNLYLDTETKILTWNSPPQEDKLLILEVTGEELSGFEFVNKYPSVVHFGGNGCTSLKPSLFKDGETQKLKISNGFSQSIIPELNGESLSENPSVTLTDSTQLWLVIEWEPSKETEEDISWITSGGEIISAEFEISTSQPSETEANVAENGTITNGVYSFLWADISKTDLEVEEGEDPISIYKITANRCGNHQVGFCPPNNLELIFD